MTFPRNTAERQAIKDQQQTIKNATDKAEQKRAVAGAKRLTVKHDLKRKP